MIDRFDKFSGKIKNSLDKEEVIDLISLITEMKPQLQLEVDNSNISKLIDNINNYSSEDGKWIISVYFRETDIYKSINGDITRGNFKTLFKITIKRSEGLTKVGELKEFINTFRNVVLSVYPDTIIKVKIDDGGMVVEEFLSIDDSQEIENIKLVIRIL